MIPILIIGIVHVLFLAWFVWCVITAPDGYEDDKGYHLVSRRGSPAQNGKARR